MRDGLGPAVTHGISQSVRRREHLRFLRGQGRYVADLAPPGLTHAVFLRSPHAHARLLGLDTAAAGDRPGVLVIFTGAELRDRAERPNAEPPHYSLTLDKVRHVGEPIAVVIAEPAAEARDAAKAILVEYVVLPAVAGLAEAQLPEAPRVWDHLPDNNCCYLKIGDRAAVETAFAAAAHRAFSSQVESPDDSENAAKQQARRVEVSHGERKPV